MKLNNKLPEEITDAICSVIGKGKTSLHEPSFNGNEEKYLKECIQTNYVSSVGKFVDKFEKHLALYTGAKRAVAIVNGTSALHLSLIIAGVKPNEEVIVPTLTFVATANAIKYCDAVPNFVDSSESNLGIDHLKLRNYLNTISKMKNGKCINIETNRVIKAIVPMHAYGHPCDIHEILLIAKEFNLKVIEDAAESLGSFILSKHTGTFGDMGVLSFNGNKTITTGGGGAIVTNNNKVADIAKHLSTTAKQAHPWHFYHDSVGFNYRMPNLNAALGCAQLESLEEFIVKKRKLFILYKDAFSKVNGVRLLEEAENCKSNYWLQTLILESENVNLLDMILKKTNNRGVMTRPTWTLMHNLPMFKNCPRADLSVAESLEKRIINIPSSSFLLD